MLIHSAMTTPTQEQSFAKNNTKSGHLPLHYTQSADMCSVQTLEHRESKFLDKRSNEQNFSRSSGSAATPMSPLPKFKYSVAADFHASLSHDDKAGSRKADWPHVVLTPKFSVDNAYRRQLPDPMR